MRTDLIDLFLGHANAEEKMDNTLIQYGGVLDRFDDWLREKHNTSLESKDISAVSGVMLTEYYQLLHSRELSVSEANFQLDRRLAETARPRRGLGGA